MHMTEDAKRIIDDSIRAVLPDAAVYRALEGRRFDRPVTVIAIGKAAWRMANAAAKALGENLREGIVITKYGHSEGDIPRMTIYEAAHPIPDEAGVAATRAALALADRGWGGLAPATSEQTHLARRRDTQLRSRRPV